MGPPQTQIGEDAASPYVAIPRVPHTFRALRHRNFRLFITGQVISLVGTWMQTAAQSWLVYRLTHSELLLGTTWFCSQIAVFALGPLGGLAADRFSRQKIVIVTQALSMLQAFALSALTITGHVQVWHVLALCSGAGHGKRLRYAGTAGARHRNDQQGRSAQCHFVELGGL